MTNHSDRRVLPRPTLLFAATMLLLTLMTAPQIAGADEFPLPLTNTKSGISLTVSGVNGRDWVVERTVHDDLIADQVFYVTAGVEFSLAHNQRNTLMAPSPKVERMLGVAGPDGTPGTGDEGDIYYKIDRDMQAHPYVTSRGALPGFCVKYAEPFAFGTLTYDGTKPVLGSIGNNGGPFGRIPGATTKRFAYGQTDPAGNEWHTLTYWDDDIPVYKKLGIRGRMAASDGHAVFVCVNPVTPVIQMTAEDGAQFYTTPIKTYHVPKIWTQTTYLTPGVMIHFVNMTNDEPIFYRIEDSEFHEYDGEPLDADDLFMPKADDIPSVLAVKCGEDGPVLERRIVFDPDHGAAEETHGLMLWGDEATKARTVKRLKTVSPFKESYRTFRGKYYQGTGYKPSAIRGQWRSGAAESSRALANAMVVAVEGVEAAETEAALCKQRLMHLARLQPVGFELNVQSVTPAKDFINELGQTTQLYADAPVAYDILAGCYRSYDHPGGMTAIEEFLIRDNLAKIAKSILQFRGNYSFTSGGGDTHWAHGYELALGATALAMPTYASDHYGVSGGDRATVNDLSDPNGKFWNPFPDQGVTWYAAATDRAIDTPGHPNVVAPLRAEFLLTDDGWWTGPNDLQGDGNRYAKGPHGNRLVDVKYGGLANAANRVELIEMSGYEAPFVLRTHTLDLMRRIAGDPNSPPCVNNYIRRRTLGGVIRLDYDKAAGIYTPTAPDVGCLAGFNSRYPYAGYPQAKQRVNKFLDQLKAYYAGGDLAPAERKRLDNVRKRMYDPYVLALCESPADIADAAPNATGLPILKPMFKYVVTPGTKIVKSVIAFASDGTPADVTVENLPTGAIYDDAARQITWTPGEADLGVHLLRVSAGKGQAIVTRPFPIIVKADLGAGPVPVQPASATVEQTEDSVRIEWAQPGGNIDVAGYAIYRDGALWAATDAKTTHFVDTERVEPLCHTRYHVAVYSKIGAESAAAEARPNPIFLTDGNRDRKQN